MRYLALALPRSFFEDYGWATGPVAWIGCSLLTGRLLALPAGLVLFAALAGGVAGFLVSLAASHAAGLVVSLLVFAASSGGYEPETDAEAHAHGVTDTPSGIRTRDLRLERAAS